MTSAKNLLTPIVKVVDKPVHFHQLWTVIQCIMISSTHSMLLWHNSDDIWANVMRHFFIQIVGKMDVQIGSTPPPPLVCICLLFPDPPPPSSADVIYGRPLPASITFKVCEVSSFYNDWERVYHYFEWERRQYVGNILQFVIVGPSYHPPVNMTI